MSLILLATILAGVVATNVMLQVHLNRLWLRYAIAVLLAYGAFLFLVKCWLFYLGVRARRERARLAIDCPIDLIDAVCDLGDLGDVGNAIVDGFQNAGGRFVDGTAIDVRTRLTERRRWRWRRFRSRTRSR